MYRALSKAVKGSHAGAVMYINREYYTASPTEAVSLELSDIDIGNEVNTAICGQFAYIWVLRRRVKKSNDKGLERERTFYQERHWEIN